MKIGEGALKSDKVDSEGEKNYWRQRMTLCNGKQVNPLQRYNNSKHVCRKKKRATKQVKQKLIELEKEIDKSIIVI